jgi:hypothetical protein
MASPPGFPRSLLTEPWSARLAHFQRYTVAHPQLIEAKEKLVAAIQNSEPNSLVFVFGPTGVGKTTLRLKAEQILTAELRAEKGVGPRTPRGGERGGGRAGIGKFFLAGPFQATAFANE